MHCRGIATKKKNGVQGLATTIEVHEGACARSGRAGNIKLMFKYDEIWGCRRGHLASLGVPRSPRHPGGDAPNVLIGIRYTDCYRWSLRTAHFNPRSPEVFSQTRRAVGGGILPPPCKPINQQP